MIRVEFKASSRHVFRPEEQAAIRAICDRAELEAREHLRGLPLTLWLTVEESSVVIPEYGSSGAALDRTHVRWRVDATRPEGVIEIAELLLRATLFHELHHLARGWVKVSAGTRPPLMDAVVSEGLATSFERDAAGHRAPWGEYPPEVRAWVDELLALPDDAPYGQWMFRHADGRRWVGYRAGTFLADQVMARVRRSAAQLVRAPPA
jgi:hypothetical protein